MGAHNSVVGADQGLRAPSWDQESVRDLVYEDSGAAPVAVCQRPRPSFRHPQGSSMGKTGLSPVGAGQGGGVGSTSALGYWVVSGMSGCWLVPSAFMIQTPLFPL